MKTKITSTQKLFASKSTFNSITITLFILCMFSLNKAKASDFYWVSGTGNWSDYANHWATTSGGVIFHTTIPSPLDDVYFDANSFLTTGDTVFANSTIINCNNMDWSGAINNPVFYYAGPGFTTIRIYGSLTLTPGMTWYSIALSFLSGNPGNTITTFGNHISPVTFDNVSGSWSLTDSLWTGRITVTNGTFSTNNQNVFCTWFYAGSDAAPYTNYATVLLGTSHIWSEFTWHATDTNYLFLDAANASFTLVGDTTLPGANPPFWGGSHQTYGDITCYTEVDGDFCHFHDIYMVREQSTIYGDQNIYHDIYFSKDGWMLGGGNMIHNVYFSGPGHLSNNNIVNKAIFNDDAYSGIGNILDTLIFNNSGKTITFKDTTTVNNELLMASGTGGFPTPVHSNAAGTKAVISIPTGDTLCTDYLYLQDIEAINGTFYAGDNSVDLGNNTGWQWSSCIPDTSSVWPGDANYDLTADNIDVLYIGLAYGYTGATRAGATTNWVAQPAVDWLQQFANGTNIKHADCDGNGTVNASDTLAVSLNYGLTHPFKNPTLPLPNNFGTDLYFDMPAGALTPGTTVSIPIKFGTALNPASNIYGIGFTVNYDAALIQAGSMQIDFSNSWLGTSGNTIHLTKDFPLTGTIDMGYVKTDHLNSNGNGTIATLTFTVANNASGYLNLSFSDILVLDRNEFPIPVNAQNATIYTSIDEQSSIESMINVYPNPASTTISITDANHIIQNVKLVDMMGREIIVKQNFESVLQLDVSKVVKGMYILSIETNKGILNKKVEIER